MGETLPLVKVTGDDLNAFAGKLRRRVREQVAVEEGVLKTIERVRKEGDAALRELTRDFDRASIGQIRVDDAEIQDSLNTVDPELLEALRFSLKRIRKTQGQILNRLSFSYVSDGFVVRTAPGALDSVGCYVPGGRAAYASTVLMTAGVAKLAGVARVIVCSPPAPDGNVNPAILAASALCGVDEVYRVGGAQSVAALAYGTESIRKVEKIVGPGGLYASVAKRLVSGQVAIDFFAGPTELVVVGDDTTDLKAAAWDLVGQAEHGEETLCGFITWDAKVAGKLRSEASRIAKNAKRGDFVRGSLARGFVALCRNREDAVELLNAIAPEHVEVLVDDPRAFATKVRNAGLVLVGKYAPCAASDYCIGTDHVIPTQGYSRLRAGLSILDFVKLNTIVEGSREGLKGVLPSLKSLAMAEGLPNHYSSVESRFRK
jgi:histidinol dehydrogenase